MEIKALIFKLAEKYGRKRENLIPILQGVVQEERYISDEAMVEIARQLDISAAQVYGTCTFYSFLNTKPKGKYIIRVCETIVCDMQGKKEVISTLEDLLKIKIGETTHNKRFSLLKTECLGWCHKGPVMLVNDEVYTELTPEKIRNIIAKYKRKH